MVRSSLRVFVNGVNLRGKVRSFNSVEEAIKEADFLCLREEPLDLIIDIQGKVIYHKSNYDSPHWFRKYLTYSG